jgi:hypothetical protein
LVMTNDAPGTVLDRRLTRVAITGTGTEWAAQAPIAGAADSRQEPDAGKKRLREPSVWLVPLAGWQKST